MLFNFNESVNNKTLCFAKKVNMCAARSPIADTIPFIR